MRNAIRAYVIVAAVGSAVWAADLPRVKSLTDAQLYVRAKMREMERKSAAAMKRAERDIERRLKLRHAAKLADLKRQLIEERARSADLQQRLRDVMGMLKSGVAATVAAHTPKRWGKPVFADDFSAPKISDKWLTKELNPKGNFFQIKDGMLTGKETIRTSQRFSGKAVRIEYDSWTLSSTPCDASALLQAPEVDFRVFAGIGGEINKMCRIVVGNEEVARKGEASLVRGKRQHMVVEVGEGKVRIEVDGRTVLLYQGAKAPKELKNVLLGLYSWTPGMHFDNVKVYVIR